MIDYPAGIRSRIIKDINGLSMNILEAGYDDNANKPCIVLLHGFPELAYSWRKIFKPLSDAGYYVIAPAECSANLARYDGIRFGHRSDDVSSLEELYVNSRSEGFGREVKNRIFIGTFCLSAGYYDAFYNKALKIRILIKGDFDEAFKKVSAIAMPTCSSSSFELGSISDPVEMYEQDIYTIPANLAGLQALSIPSGKVDNMPVGLQLIGNYLEEGKILNLANKFQKLTDFHEFK